MSGNGEQYWLRKQLVCISQQTELPPQLTVARAELDLMTRVELVDQLAWAELVDQAAKGKAENLNRGKGRAGDYHSGTGRAEELELEEHSSP